MTERTLVLPSIVTRWLVATVATLASAAHAGIGLMEWPANSISGPVTVFYPTQASPAVVSRGGVPLEVAADAVPVSARARLVVISHGSPGSPWMHVELARSLVEAGFTVALPEHQADNAHDSSDPGPPAWRRRPVEVSRAIDRLASEPAFASALDFTRVGMFGMSAGGHTALTLAGGRWSPSRLREHCRRNLAEDFHACAGPSVALSGGMLDGLKMRIVTAINERKWDDPSWYGHADPRIVAVVAGVPFAADFDPDSLRHPTAALALVHAQDDRWLVPRFHGGAVALACRSCEPLLHLSTGGHGALLGPLPPARVLSELVRDPPGFDRATEVPRINAAITGFFSKVLVEPVR